MVREGNIGPVRFSHSGHKTNYRGVGILEEMAREGIKCEECFAVLRNAKENKCLELLFGMEELKLCMIRAAP